MGECVDVVVVGGGVAGLWTAWALRRAGRSVVLIERDALGAGQTVWSQGIIHAGLKYRLPGSSADASRAVAAMRDRWAEALGLSGEDVTPANLPDLRATRVLSRRTWMWTTPSLASRAAAKGAALAMRSGVRALDMSERPEGLFDAPESVSVYAVDEFVVDAGSLLASLYAAVGEVRTASVTSIRDAGASVVIETSAERLEAAQVVLAAGCGNEHLLERAGIDHTPHTQRRPLHMVYARGKLPPVFGHCLGASSVPRLTITSAEHEGATVWAIGGAIAEDGIDRDEAAQIAAARAEIDACLPWIDLGSASWACARVDRCEARAGGKRPDGAVVREWGRVIGVWPTKLALAPAAADEVVGVLEAGDSPTADRETSPTIRGWDAAFETRHEPAPVAPLPWEGALRWV